MSAFTKALTERKDHAMLSEHSRSATGDPAEAQKDPLEKAKAEAKKDGKDWTKLPANDRAEYLMAAGYGASSYADEEEVQ
jgi:acyl-CoA reductase-like NAD-dependent aldehyde dehydrogenase